MEDVIIITLINNINRGSMLPVNVSPMGSNKNSPIPMLQDDEKESTYTLSQFLSSCPYQASKSCSPTIPTDDIQWKKNSTQVELGRFYDQKRRAPPQPITEEIMKQLNIDCPDLQSLTIKNARKIDACIPLLSQFKSLNTFNLHTTDVTGAKLSELPKSIKKIQLIECQKLRDDDMIKLAKPWLHKLYVCGCTGVSADFINGPKQSNEYDGVRAVRCASQPTFCEQAPLTEIYYSPSVFQPIKNPLKPCFQPIKKGWIDEEGDPDYEPPKSKVDKAVLTNRLDFFTPPPEMSNK